MMRYIGVTGFTSREQVDRALDGFPHCGRRLMVGVLVSRKTLYSSGYNSGRKPLVENIAGIFPNDQRCLNLLHFYSEERPNRYDLEELIEIGGPNLHGIQWNGMWPRDSVISWAKGTKNLYMVCQFRTNGRVDARKTLADAYLIDDSCGEGRGFDVTSVSYWHGKINEAHPGSHVGFAGGLDASAFDDAGMVDLVRSGLSCDAESKLMGADDALDMGKVAAYLRKAAACAA